MTKNGARGDAKKKEPGAITAKLRLAAARVRGVPVLCFVAGLALVADHLLTGVLAIPFFGAHAFVWGNVLGAFVLSLALGIGGGGVLGWLAAGPPRSPWRLASLSGVLIAAATWGLPR